VTPSEAVDEIWSDLLGRSGGDAFLEAISLDIQAKIKNDWLGIIEEVEITARREEAGEEWDVLR
jgi:hypothetical protein